MKNIQIYMQHMIPSHISLSLKKEKGKNAVYVIFTILFNNFIETD